jgi:hypothetical protein
MPSYPIKTDAATTPHASADFNLGIAEQWLEAVRNGGGAGDPVLEIQDTVSTALANCRDARKLLREIPARLPVVQSEKGERSGKTDSEERG